MKEKVTPREARQGRSNTNMLVVLIVGMTLALLALGIFEWANGVPG